MIDIAKARALVDVFRDQSQRIICQGTSPFALKVADLIDALLDEVERQRALTVAWEQKAATWSASPEAAKRLDGYRELAAQVAKAQNERDALARDAAEIGREM